MPKSLLTPLLLLSLLTSSACSQEDPNPGPITPQPPVAAPAGGVAVYLNQIAILYPKATATIQSDPSERRYHVATGLSNTQPELLLTFVTAPNEPLPVGKSLPLTLTVNPGSPSTRVVGTGTGILTVEPAPASQLRQFTGTFSGTAGNYQLEGGTFTAVLTR